MVEAMAPRAETVIIVTADHGEGLGEHELLDHRSSVYQTLLAVPCIIRYPARFPVGRTKLPINLIDLFPTMLDLAGISTASIPKGIAGYSLCDAEKQVPRSRALISERLPIRPHNPAEDFGLQAPPLPAEAGFPLLRTIIKDGQKLIWRDDQTMELYQLSNDRAESTNLIQGSMLTAKALLAELDLWVKTSGAEQLPNPTMPPPLPADPHLLQEIKALGYIRP
jgi:arylsulfatase A-like enzyme